MLSGHHGRSPAQLSAGMRATFASHDGSAASTANIVQEEQHPLLVDAGPSRKPAIENADDHGGSDNNRHARQIRRHCQCARPKSVQACEQRIVPTVRPCPQTKHRQCDQGNERHEGRDAENQNAATGYRPRKLPRRHVAAASATCSGSPSRENGFWSMPSSLRSWR